MEYSKGFFRRTVVVATLPLFAACSGAGEPTTGSESPATSAPVLTTSTVGLLSNPLTLPSVTPTTHKIIRRSGQTILLISQSLPSADCALTNADVAVTPENVQELSSDSLGRVRFFVDPGTTNGEPINLLLSCQTDDGSASTTPIELDVGDNPNVEDEVLNVPGTPRPALTGDPMSYTQAQLVAAGFPPRPDPTQAPDDYNRWLALASQPALRSTSKPVTTHRSNASTSSTYSGLSTSSALAFERASAGWTVPAVVGENNLPNCNGSITSGSSIWPGLWGAAGTNGLIQDGTAQYVTTYDGRCTIVSTWSYVAWVEYYPYSQVNVFNVNPGDSVFAEAWSGDSSCNLTTTGAYGCFYIQDYTSPGPSGVYWSGSIAKKPGATYSPGIAWWILENPNGGAQSLADYGSATFTSPYSFDTTNGSVEAFNQGTTIWEMYIGSTLLSYSYGVTYTNTIPLQWKNYY